MPLRAWTLPFTYLLTHSMDQNPSWEANSFSVSEEITRILWKPNVHYTAVKSALWLFRNIIRFYSVELLAHRPTPKLEDHPLSSVRYRLFNIFARTLHIVGPLNFFVMQETSERFGLHAGNEIQYREWRLSNYVIYMHCFTCLFVNVHIYIYIKYSKNIPISGNIYFKNAIFSIDNHV